MSAFERYMADMMVRAYTYSAIAYQNEADAARRAGNMPWVETHLLRASSCWSAAIKQGIVPE